MKKILSFLVVILPWALKRPMLKLIWKYDIHPKARIGLAYVFPKHLVMKEGSKIDHFTVGIHVDLIHLEVKSKIGRSNWITGFPLGTKSKHFKHQLLRKSELVIGSNSAITKNHHIDCTNSIKIGSFSTIAGYNSQFLTHSVDVYENRQHSEPIEIGDYTFVGTNVTVLGGAILPSHSVLGAKSLLNKRFEETWMLYSGIPAKPIKDIDPSAKYFSRLEGFVN
ncbi:hypothetical protein M8998_11955 [Sphingobacterium sp. lm-10]|uniref:acyltransferase n=1 Tax=Sphingobacterium sp. lm-10 TaxID=2944904 RepID=UPI002020B3EF|nr:hypothetical protein [Sphingobacterium sp. lm-10]MCL7988652.1 hypothetical protein [Sphingobacterium sp. lm-10]